MMWKQPWGIKKLKKQNKIIAKGCIDAALLLPRNNYKKTLLHLRKNKVPPGDIAFLYPFSSV